jgi:O-antigen/teichoic acid export membrane protein
MSSATIRFLPQFTVRKEWDRALGLLRGAWAIVLASSVAVAVAGTLAAVVAARFGVAHTTAFMIGAWIVPPLAIISLQAEMARASRRIALGYAPPQVGKSLILIVLGFAVVRSTGSLASPAALAMNFTALSVLCAGQLVVLWRGLPLEMRAARPRYEPRQWFSVSLPMLLVAGYTMVLNQADVLLIGAWLGPEPVGMYQAAVKTAALVSLALSASNAAAGPVYASLHTKGDARELQKLISTSVTWAFLPSLAIFLVLVVFGEHILRLFGPGFARVRWQLAILAVGQVVNAASGPVTTLLSVSGHQRQCSRVFGWAALMNVAANAVAIPLAGITGAAIATASTVITLNVWLYVLVRRELGIRSRVSLPVVARALR